MYNNGFTEAEMQLKPLMQAPLYLGLSLYILSEVHGLNTTCNRQKESPIRGLRLLNAWIGLSETYDRLAAKREATTHYTLNKQGRNKLGYQIFSVGVGVW